MDIKTLASILLFGRLISVFFMVLVINKQIALFKLQAQSEIAKIRRRLFALSMVVLLGNIFPVVIDIATIMADDSLRRTQHPATVGIIYSIDACVTSALSAIFIWSVYKMADRLAIQEQYK